jgi:general secretion pathway protein G
MKQGHTNRGLVAGWVSAAMAGWLIGTPAGVSAGPSETTTILSKTVRPSPDKPKVVSKAAGIERAKADMLAIKPALAMYKLNAGTYPTTQQGLVSLVGKPAIEPIPRRWVKIMEKIPADPWGNPYRYSFPGKNDPAIFDLSSNGPDGLADTADDVRNEK